jgi:hypothetical protein
VKKLAAVIIACILLFNWGAYRWVFSYLENNATAVLNTRLDARNFDESALITIKLPVENLPYYTNSPVFERVTGELSIGGMKYQYVEKRIFHDSLEMRCIPNAQSTHLNNARDEFFKLVNDLQQTSSSGKQQPSKSSVSFKNILGDYLENERPSLFTPVFNESVLTYQLYQLHLPSLQISTLEQPPDIA